MPNLATLISRTLPEQAEALLREAARVAGANPDACAELYLVGGPVRDLLLGATPADLDLSVVGDAGRFAAALAAELGGEVSGHSEFGTVKLSARGYDIDLATARAETYAHPGALPDVWPAGITGDLARRDFTVNAMAVDLGVTDPGRWGELIDNHGGMTDVTTRRLRVLHDDSFVDDPTRILRAVRYGARLGFQIERGTRDLLARDVDGLAAISAARIRAELEHILAEPSRAAALASAEELGALAAVSPALRVPRRTLEVMARLAGDDADRPLLFYIALLGAALTASEAEALVRRLDPPRAWADVLGAGPAYRAVARVLERDDLRPSEAADVLSPFPRAALEAQLELGPLPAQQRWLKAWLTDLSRRRPALTGDDLLAEGVPQGPLVGKLLDELRRAALDRTARTRDEELALVRRRLPTLLDREQG